MSRPPRISFKGALYLVTQKGNNKSRIFVDDDDRRHFLDLMCVNTEIYRCILYAYVLMENYLHMIVETRQLNISRFMHAVSTGYTIAFNKKYHKQGHLFQGRYKSVIMEVELSRYLHLNPVILKLVEKPELYPWSSYADYNSKLCHQETWGKNQEKQCLKRKPSNDI